MASKTYGRRGYVQARQIVNDLTEADGCLYAGGRREKGDGGAVMRAIQHSALAPRQEMRFMSSVNDPLYNDFRGGLRATTEMLIDLGYGHFLPGGARGMDTWLAEDVLELKRTHPEIALETVAPYAAQSERWSDIDRKKHAGLFAAAKRFRV